MKSFLAICRIGLSIMVWAGLTPAIEARAAEPVIALDQDIYAFGQVVESETITHDFRIFNRGDTPLEIKSVKPGCGCSIARFDRTIPPGGEGKITLELNTNGYQGNIHKTARVETNDPKRSQFVIGMTGSV